MGMLLKTRLDRLVQLRERTEDGALSNLARARQALGRAQDRLAGAVAAARSDARAAADSAFWAVEEAANGRALQLVRVAHQDVSRAAAGEAAARQGYAEARTSAESARRVADRKRAEILKGQARVEARRLDELGATGFHRSRPSGT
jgi:flagellar export protein FliJ